MGNVLGSFWMHVVYFAAVMYCYKAYETYKVQLALGVPAKKAAKSGLVWPKYFLGLK